MKRVGTYCLTCISLCHSHLESVIGLECRTVENEFLATEEPSAGSLLTQASGSHRPERCSSEAGLSQKALWLLPASDGQGGCEEPRHLREGPLEGPPTQQGRIRETWNAEPPEGV